MLQETVERPISRQLPADVVSGESQQRCDPIKGLLAGAAGGLAATFVMTMFQNAMTKFTQPLSREEESEQRKQVQGESDPATVQAADAISHSIRGRGISESHKPLAGQAMHYSFGTSMGMIYGIAAEYGPGVTAGQGSAFGAALMLGADEVAVPLAGLSDPPTQTPLSTHVYALLAHIVYGVACEQVRRKLRSAMG